MSNLLKSKILVGVFAFALMFAGVVAVNTANAATCDMGMTTLRQGSKGEAVRCLQQTLNAKGFTVATTGAGSMGMETTTFGPATANAVRSFQASAGLKADAVVGAMTRGALNAAVVTTPTTPTTPGATCPNGNLLANNCQPSTTTTGPVVLTGTTGELENITKKTSGVETKATEGQRENVLGFELEAGNDSDLLVSSVRLALTQSGNGSNRLERYFDEVSVWNGNTKVGSANAVDFSRDVNTSSRSVNLSNVVIKKGEKLRLTVAVEVNNSIRSSSTPSLNDLGATWTVDLMQVRVVDASGAILTETPTSAVNSAFTFEAANANDEVKVQSAGSVNPAATNLKVDDNGTSSSYKVFAFKLKAENNSSDINVLELPVNISIMNPQSGVTTVNAEDVISDMWLKVGSKEFTDYNFSNFTINNGSTTSGTSTFEIEEGELEITAGTSVNVELYVEFGSQNTKYDANTTVQFSVNGVNFEIENVNGDTVDMSNASTITGNTHTLILEAVNFAMKTATVSPSTETQGIDPFVTITMPIEITTDETLYILKNAGATAVSMTVTGGATNVESFVGGSNVPSIVTVGGNDYYEVSGSGTIYVRTIVTGDITGTIGTVNVQLNSIDAALSAGGSTTTYNLAPASNFDVDATLRY